MNSYKRLTRSRKNRIIGGVAGGLGEYFDMDPILLRILFIFLTLFGGAGLILYLVLLIVMPEDLSNPFGETVETETFIMDEDGNTIYEKQVENEETGSANNFNNKKQDIPRQKNNRIITTAIGLTLILLGSFILLSHFVSFNWYKYLLPCILLAAGIIILVSSSRSKR